MPDKYAATRAALAGAEPAAALIPAPPTDTSRNEVSGLDALELAPADSRSRGTARSGARPGPR